MSSFLGVVPPDDVVYFKPGNASVLIWYQVDNFTCAWLAEWFAGESQIYLRFTCKLSTLDHFLLELGYEDYSFLDQAVVESEHGLDSVFTDFIYTLEVDAFFKEPDSNAS